jgi:hypothetical protein
LTLFGFCTKAFDLSLGLQLGLFFFAHPRLCLPTALFLAHTHLLYLPSSSLFSLSKKLLALPALKLLTLQLPLDLLSPLILLLTQQLLFSLSHQLLKSRIHIIWMEEGVVRRMERGITFWAM